MTYIYKAELYCDDCGKRIREELDALVGTPEDVKNEDAYDSDDYPEYIGKSDESDTPNHCGSHKLCLDPVVLFDPVNKVEFKVGKLLTTVLTADGIDYVRKHIEDEGEYDSPYFSPVVAHWREVYKDQIGK